MKLSLIEAPPGISPLFASSFRGDLMIGVERACERLYDKDVLLAG